MAQINKINKHQIRKILTRHIGIALGIAFILVTAMFIALYVNSANRQNQEVGGSYNNGDSMGMTGDEAFGEDGASGGLQSGSPDHLAPGATDVNDLANPDDTTNTDNPHQTNNDNPSDPDDYTNPDGPAGGQQTGDSYGNGSLQSDPDQAQTGEPVRVAYLTFDDGPDRDITPGILDILLEEDIRATFFVLPYQGLDDLYQRIIDEGHEIGNHSFSHVYERLYERDASRFRDDILRARNFIFDNFEYTTTSFRFPGGQQRAGNGLNARLEALREFGYRHFHWHVDPDDWRVGRTAAEVRASVREQATNHVRNDREHVIILMHDRYQRTLDALPGIISDLRELGFEFDIVRNMP
ncbi:MAG: polysaccharide deacetylase family protein [Oscillospiraceae bacterium]|nr:polysaccharide deacetylase family protein [Oscillospiraceae bacterium]